MLRKLLACTLLFSSLSATDDAAKISEAMGHLIGKNLQSLGMEIDFEALVKGMSDESSGKSSPMDEAECIEAIALLQEEGLRRLAKKNLEQTNAFLQENRKKEGIVSLEEGKLQYQIIQKGEGEAVAPYNSPLVRLTGRLSTGEPIGEIEEVISLEEAIPGLHKGLLGMKEGEKRTLYIHPDLGYGQEGNPHPNALVIFEVEVIQADAAFGNDPDEIPLAPESALEDESISR